ncbi:TonB-dependent receptor [Campylobacter geochelonis]|uniref:TonB-dependent receptor n=1 Tax=Campylobacter geochelonis TaxID=1780362 RepID=UPI000770B57A|nr:TonB-dependent receptor [Campylobacter geochelonis]CZE47799.1 ferric receptor CfrA [Campylobacter geochelonis]CZE50870.1 ferric receptor CfrA [Campylobacter geochelonis]
MSHKFKLTMSIICITKALSAQDSVPLNEIVVSSRSNTHLKDSSANIKIITQNQIKEQLRISTNSSDVLAALIPSYTPSRGKMTALGETMRGRMPLVLIDGVPQINATRVSGRGLHTIDFSMVEKIEVINGATANNGSAGVGGVINIVTKKQRSDEIEQNLNISLQTPTNGANKNSLGHKVGYTLGGGKENFDYLFGLSYENQGLWLDANKNAIGSQNVQGDLMNSKSYDILVKFGYYIDDDQHLSFSLNRYEIKSKANYIPVVGSKKDRILTTSTKGKPIGDAPYNQATTASISYENSDFFGSNLYVMAFSQTFDGLFGATNSAGFQDAAIAKKGLLYDQSQIKSQKYGTKTTINNGDFFDEALNLTFGFDTLYDKTSQNLHLTNRTWVPEITYTSYAPFVLTSYKITPNLSFNAGLRYEMTNLKIQKYKTLASYGGVFVAGGELEFKQYLKNFGLVYGINEQINLFANYSQGFALPDIGRVLRGIDKAGFDISSFSNLKPVITDNYEVGLRGEFEIFDFVASIYQSSSDFGTRVVNNKNNQFELHRQKTRVRGFELDAGIKLNENNKLNLTYAYSQGLYDSDNDGSLDKKLSGLEMAPNKLSAMLSTKFSDKFATTIQANHYFDRKFDDNSNNFDGYTLVDVGGIYKSRYGEFSIGVSNLLNKQYTTYYSQSSNSQDINYIAGRGRVLNLGYLLKF